jgi:uncharacterized protein YdeI (YjbR/CyaY-like superfamily)
LADAARLVQDAVSAPATARETKVQPSPKVDAFLDRAETWRPEFERLRAIILSCDLEEGLKWGQPCYTLPGGHNVCLIHGFKDYCAILFMKGALLNDPAGVLIQQTENVQSARQIRFTSAAQIAGMENVLKDYIQQAIEVERAGLKVVKKQTGAFPVPEEFAARLASDPALKTAFEALTPGRQRGYLLYFASAKQSKTRQTRVEASIPAILAGKGRDD